MNFEGNWFNKDEREVLRLQREENKETYALEVEKLYQKGYLSQSGIRIEEAGPGQYHILNTFHFSPDSIIKEIDENTFQGEGKVYRRM